MLLKKYVFILIGITLTTAAFARQANITGIVRDVNTHREISNVNIYLKDTGIGTISNYAGHYTLHIPDVSSAITILFRHIAYESCAISIDSLRTNPNVYLQPRVIPLPGVEVIEEGEHRLEIDKDLPQRVAVLEARNFEIRGYVDAGDLLKTDHSIQVEEELSGKKTVSIRGGNPDDVVVLYNGIKLNRNYDNAFDLSLVDLEDIERFEIIKGSNTTLYGAEAFSGVINIVPKTQQNYNIRLQQRFGTYQTNNSGLHLYKKLSRLHSSYSFKRGSSRRKFLGIPEGMDGLEN
jgi:hypothetical protein